MPFFEHLECIRKKNRVDPVAQSYHSVGAMLLSAFALATIILLLAQCIAAATRIHAGAATWLPAIIGIWFGAAISTSLGRLHSQHLLRTWIEVLPLNTDILNLHWKRMTRRRSLALGGLSAACLSLSMAIAETAWTTILFTALLAISATVITLMLVLAAGPSRPASSRLAPSTQRLRPLRMLESPRARWLGLWQWRLNWTPLRLAGTLLTASGAWCFSVAVGRAQDTALPVLLTALLFAVTVLNQSLDGRVLHSTVLRSMPLRPRQRLRVWLHGPACLSFISFVIYAASGLLFLPDGSIGAATLAFACLTITAWAILCLLRIAVVLRWPSGGLQSDIAYMMGLCVVGLLIQSLGPAGGAMAFIWMSIDLARSTKRMQP